MKTIKEVSESIGISKVSIYKALKRPEMTHYIFKDKDNKTIINETGEKLLISLFNREKSDTINDLADSLLTDNKQVNEDDSLVLTVLRDELKQKNEEINRLLDIITNQQKLQATQYIVDKSTEITPDKPKKSFFDKFFKRD